MQRCIQVYDPETTFQPASAFTFTGILSTSTLPINDDGDDDDQDGAAVLPSVPTLHVLSAPYPCYPLQPTTVAQDVKSTRDEVIQELIKNSRGALNPKDTLAAEFLLLALIGSVSTRVPGAGGQPLGTLALNLLVPKTEPASTDDKVDYFAGLTSTIQTVCPLVSDLNLTINLLSDHSFYPISPLNPGPSSSGLQSGLLQLAPSTIVVVNEDTLEGGNLKDKAVKNLKALMGVIKGQKLRYEFPYVDEEWGMETDLGIVVVGQAKSFLPVS